MYRKELVYKMQMGILNEKRENLVWFLRIWRHDTRTLTNKTESGLN